MFFFSGKSLLEAEAWKTLLVYKSVHGHKGLHYLLLGAEKIAARTLKLS